MALVIGSVKDFLIPGVSVIALFFLLLAVRNVTFRYLHRLGGKTETRAGDVIIATFKTPSIFWCMAISLYIGLAISSIADKYVFFFNRSIYIIIILSVTIATANLLAKILENYIQRSNIPIPKAGIVYGVLKGSVLIVGGLIIFGSLGISITPLITALGVGGLAVALALQETLSNLFAGLQIIASRQVRPGDYAKLNTGEEGYVTDITWRNTTVRALADNLIIIPNSKFASSIITNFDLPNKEMGVTIQISVAYGSNLEKVEKVTQEVAKRIMREVAGGIPGFEPTIRFHTLGDVGIQLNVNLRVRAFVDQYAVKHEFIKMLMEEYSQEEIQLPFPVARGNVKEQ
jgi:small-conductance mechanosensitive channel